MKLGTKFLNPQGLVLMVCPQTQKVGNKMPPTVHCNTCTEYSMNYASTYALENLFFNRGTYQKYQILCITRLFLKSKQIQRRRYSINTGQ